MNERYIASNSIEFNSAITHLNEGAYATSYNYSGAAITLSNFQYHGGTSITNQITSVVGANAVSFTMASNDGTSFSSGCIIEATTGATMGFNEPGVYGCTSGAVTTSTTTATPVSFPSTTGTFTVTVLPKSISLTSIINFILKRADEVFVMNGHRANSTSIRNINLEE